MYTVESSNTIRKGVTGKGTLARVVHLRLSLSLGTRVVPTLLVHSQYTTHNPSMDVIASRAVRC